MKQISTTVPTSALLKARSALQSKLNQRGQLSASESIRLMQITQTLDARHANA